MKVVKKSIRILSYIICICIVITLLLILPDFFGYHSITVLSKDMTPDYRFGSLTYYQIKDLNEMTENTPIIFRDEKGISCIQWVSEKNDQEMYFLTKNNYEQTKRVGYEQVMGKGISVSLLFLGFLVEYIRKWYVIVIMAIILLTDILLNTGNRKSKF